MCLGWRNEDDGRARFLEGERIRTGHAAITKALWYSVQSCHLKRCAPDN